MGAIGKSRRNYYQLLLTRSQPLIKIIIDRFSDKNNLENSINFIIRMSINLLNF